MAKQPKQLTTDELLAQFDSLNVDVPATTAADTPDKPDKPEQDILAELQDLAAQRPTSRPDTPRQSSTLSRQEKTKPAEKTATAPRTSQEKEKGKTAEKTAPPPADDTHDTPETETHDTPQSQSQSTSTATATESSSSGGSWWGGLFATASAAVKQAEAAVKDIQKNEDAQRWAEQVKGRVGGLKGLGDELRTIALPTFTSLIHTLAPPISSHELLQIHMTHDMQGYPSLDPLVYAVFARVMAQVEGGDLQVIQRSREFQKSGHDRQSTAGWDDGPWWRSASAAFPRSIGAVRDAAVATKLARASAEEYAREYYATRGGLEEAMKQASEISSEENPVRNSDIFIALQAVNELVRRDLFQQRSAGNSNNEAQDDDAEEEEEEEEVCFAIYLHDPVHRISCATTTQALPQKWIDWLDGPPAADSTHAYPADANADDDNDSHSVVPREIADIVDSGGVDPREWVADWMREAISLGLGVVAQRYVARRMGVGEGGSQGSLRAAPATVIESGAGEAARGL